VVILRRGRFSGTQANMIAFEEIMQEKLLHVNGFSEEF